MKIKNLMLKNFAKVSEILVSFDDNITYLIGENASGKTTVGLNGVWFVFKGLAQKGDGLIAERFRFIGPHSKSAKAEITIYDEAEGEWDVLSTDIDKRTRTACARVDQLGDFAIVAAGSVSSGFFSAAWWHVWWHTAAFVAGVAMVIAIAAWGWRRHRYRW